MAPSIVERVHISKFDSKQLIVFSEASYSGFLVLAMPCLPVTGYRDPSEGGVTLGEAIGSHSIWYLHVEIFHFFIIIFITILFLDAIINGIAF